MDWSKVGTAVAKIAPALGGALVGPGSAAIGQLVASALGASDDPAAVYQAMASDPLTVAKLRELENRHRERLEELALKRVTAELDANTERHSASQKTIQAEAQHGTNYVKETRPRVARASGYATIAYVLVAEAARLLTAALGVDGVGVAGANIAVAGVLFSPCGTYMTMRTFDGFSGRGRS